MMKAFIIPALLTIIIGNIGAVDIGSYGFINHMRSISEPQIPEIYEDAVIFTASASFRRVGISFAHDDYAKVHWFRHFFIPRDEADFYVNGRRQRGMDPNIDSGIMFHVEPIPEQLRNMDYRMVIEGLWTTDPLNPISITGPSGIAASRVPLPQRPQLFTEPVQPGTFRFHFHADPGETVTVGGSFNNWDPFMYVMQETRPGFFTLTLQLPPGNFQYAFFHRGEQVPDLSHSRRLFSRYGRIVSEGTVY